MSRPARSSQPNGARSFHRKPSLNHSLAGSDRRRIGVRTAKLVRRRLAAQPCSRRSPSHPPIVDNGKVFALSHYWSSPSRRFIHGGDWSPRQSRSGSGRFSRLVGHPLAASTSGSRCSWPTVTISLRGYAAFLQCALFRWQIHPPALPARPANPPQSSRQLRAASQSSGHSQSLGRR